MSGRPTKYDPKLNDLVYKLCLLSATDKEVANILEINEDTLNEWKKKYPEFSESLKRGKHNADANVADRLYQRAMGYEHSDLYITQYQGDIVKEEITKYYPPDTTACIFWLKNRQSEHWREKQEIQAEIKVNELNYNGLYLPSDAK